VVDSRVVEEGPRRISGVATSSPAVHVAVSASSERRHSANDDIHELP
jgi:hypothetical protein